MTFSPPRRLPILSLFTLAAVAAALAIGGARASGAGEPALASGYDFAVYPSNVCGTPLATRNSPYLTRDDCAFGEVTLAGKPDGTDVRVRLTGSDGTVLEEMGAESQGDGVWRYEIEPAGDWPSGPVTVTTEVGTVEADGTGTFFINQLGADVSPKDGTYRPGDDIPVTGEIYEQRNVYATGLEKTGAPAAFKLRAIGPDGQTLGTTDELQAADDGAIDATLPGSITDGLEPTAATNYRETMRIEVVDATSDGGWAADGITAGTATVTAVPSEPVLENAFVSSLGWVKPGDDYPFTVRVKNFKATPVSGSQVTITPPDGTTVASPTWDAGTIPAATEDGPGVKEHVFEAKADSLAQDPQIVWKDLSSLATLTYTGGDAVEARSHGPKVIPPSGGYETSRYGDRPFPVVPVDYSDRSHEEASTAGKLAGKINDPESPGSTFNLYQEMSYGQLFPNGTVPSAGIASANWEYGDGFAFTKNTGDADSCRGVSNATLPGDTYQQLQPERIKDGWYQLPGPTDYYGDDSNGSAVIGSVAGVGALQAIDSACGPTGKAVYDAAQIADPEIDYNDYDTDKDGVVDFFMMVFAGLGGNGDSQVNGVPPYDNIWPHSSDLQGAYSDPDTGEKGYVTDDQLTDLEGRPLFYTDESRTGKTTDETDYPVHVRVGPYNVNPESAIKKASVISHEYGHSLGLPDYYSTGSRETYGKWTLMAEDHSQNIDIVGKKELGWVVPRVLAAGQTVDASDWKDTKVDTNRIDWKQPDGTPYQLTGATVHNGEAYTAPLPRRQIIDPSLVPSGDKLQWSGSGNDFGCPPTGGHNVDIALPGLADVPAGTPITLTFKSRWDIEWDYDYGFVLTSTDSGKSYQSHESANGYTTPGSQNPNANGCQQSYGNGLTGSSGSYDSGTQTVDRVASNYPDAPFVDDEYDLSDLAGKASVLRLSYATDPGLARPGWFVDDLQVKAGDRVIYSSDFESTTDEAVYNGGCRESLQTAQQCTDGWQQISASDGSPAEHAYLMEMRDRSGFDADGRGEDDREPLDWTAGMLLAYTDENHGYGNVGTDDPPAQSPLDSQPVPEDEAPDLSDAAFTADEGDSHFTDSGEGHVDNYSDPSRDDGLWRFDFDCLTFDVEQMGGQDVDAEARNLIGDVTFKAGSGCGPFDYGTSETGGGGGAHGAPTARAQARPTAAKTGETVRFDGSGSFDDADAPENLTYAWDFDGNGTEDAKGREAEHAYDRAGSYDAKLTVTDTGGRSATDTVNVTITDAATGGTGTGTSSGSGGGGTAGGGSGQGAAGGVKGGSAACATVSAFRSLKVTPKGSGLRFAFARSRPGDVVVDVFRAATGRRVTEVERVARFAGRTRSFSWDGGGAASGTYFTRVALRSNGRRLDVRRAAFERRGGAFAKRAAFARRDGCGPIRTFKLERPVFGGRTRPLAVSFRLASTHRAVVDVLRGGKVVKRVSSRRRTGLRTYRLRVSARGLARGEYRIRLRAGQAKATLGARRL